MHVYPDIGLNPTKFPYIPSILLFYFILHIYFIAEGYWSEFSNRKLFFDNFAKEKKFDYSVPENWYMVLSKDIEARKV